MDPTEWHQVHHRGSVRHRVASRRPPTPPLQDGKPLVRCWRAGMHCACASSCDPSADAASAVQAMPSRFNMLLEDEETASVTEEDSKGECTAAGRITADVRWQACPRQHR